MFLLYIAINFFARAVISQGRVLWECWHRRKIAHIKQKDLVKLLHGIICLAQKAQLGNGLFTSSGLELRNVTTLNILTSMVITEKLNLP